MTNKQFKTKFKKSREIIENELDKITAYSEELDDIDLSEIIQDMINNVYITIIESTSEQPSNTNLASYEEYIEEVEALKAEFDDEETNNEEE